MEEEEGERAYADDRDARDAAVVRVFLEGVDACATRTHRRISLPFLEEWRGKERKETDDAPPTA